MAPRNFRRLEASFAAPSVSALGRTAKTILTWPGRKNWSEARNQVALLPGDLRNALLEKTISAQEDVSLDDMKRDLRLSAPALGLFS